jgi:ATP-binding protein involved in chromosome partitioning
MPDVTDKQVLEALRAVQDPLVRQDVVSLRRVKDLAVCGGSVRFRLEFPSADYPPRDAVKAAAEAAVRALPGVRQVTVETGARVAAAPHDHGSARIPGVKNIIAVASGKGGVGKSTVSVNLALALARGGASVGLLDVDVYGPSVPGLLGVPKLPDGSYDIRVADGRMVPPVQHGLRVVSLGFFTREDEPVIVRGPILDKAVQQFLFEVDWGTLDYLVCDLPPGTGDVPLSLAQKVPLTGIVVVATPQDVALRIAAKSIRMFEKLRVDILGIVENMSWFVCPHCGGRTEIFAHGGARKACDTYHVPFLGEIPLDPEVRIAGDAGRPVMIEHPDGPQAKAFQAVAAAVAAQVEAANRRREDEPPIPPVSFVKTGPMEV